MSALFPRNSNSVRKDDYFDKDAIVEEIKNQLPEPWIWYTVENCMGTNDFPTYDLLITRKKIVNEELRIDQNPFTSFRTVVEGTYSISLGIDVINKPSSIFEMSDPLVTAGIQINSSKNLFDILRKIDNNPGGISNG